jgi:hypothetical protein
LSEKHSNTQEQRTVALAASASISAGVIEQVRTKAPVNLGQARAVAKRNGQNKKLRREVSLG